MGEGVKASIWSLFLSLRNSSRNRVSGGVVHLPLDYIEVLIFSSQPAGWSPYCGLSRDADLWSSVFGRLGSLQALGKISVVRGCVSWFWLGGKKDGAYAHMHSHTCRTYLVLSRIAGLFSYGIFSCKSVFKLHLRAAIGWLVGVWVRRLLLSCKLPNGSLSAASHLPMIWQP